VDDAVPEIQEVHVVEFLRDNLVIDRTEQSCGRFIGVDIVGQIFSDGGVIGTVVFGTEPASYLSYPVDLFGFIFTRGKGLFDLLVLFLRDSVSLGTLISRKVLPLRFSSQFLVK
jgi:hypothetical protein